ncbi:MAG: hypothetical protein IKE20_01190 [Eggerthellaceae bacterium]|nr:hypothetical protein [Eggerthellaceae bacterium]
MSSESFVGLGALLLVPAILPLAVAAAGVGLAGAAVYGGAKAAQESYEAHKRRLAEQYGLEKEQLEALDRAVGNIAKARESLAEMIREQVTREQESTVSATPFGALTASVAEQITSESIADTSAQTNQAASGFADDPIDFSDLFATDLEAVRVGEQVSPEKYLANAEKRISGLMAFTNEEKGAQERLLKRCEMMSGADMTLSDIELAIGQQVEDLCVRLSEGEGELRRQAFLDYISMCSLVGEKPRELSYEAMIETTTELGETYVKSQLQGSVFDSVMESLSQVGLEDAGIVTFDGEDGYLIVDEDDKTCGIFLRKSDDNESFLFTTVSAQEPSRVGVGEKRQILASAQRLCDKKRELFEEVLPKAGVRVEVEYEYDPPSIDCIHRMPQFAERARAAQAQATAAQASTENAKHQEE